MKILKASESALGHLLCLSCYSCFPAPLGLHYISYCLGGISGLPVNFGSLTDSCYIARPTRYISALFFLLSLTDFKEIPQHRHGNHISPLGSQGWEDGVSMVVVVGLSSKQIGSLPINSLSFLPPVSWTKHSIWPGRYLCKVICFVSSCLPLRQ
jgi:hypothetical protein